MSNAEQIIAPGLLAQPEQPLSANVTRFDRQVVLHLSQPREFVAFTGMEPVIIGARMLAHAMDADMSTAKAVLELCTTLADAAHAADGGLKPAGGAVKHELIERHRRTLTKRLEIILNSQREKKKVSNAQLAKLMVDTMLSEVFS